LIPVARLRESIVLNISTITVCLNEYNILSFLIKFKNGRNFSRL